MSEYNPTEKSEVVEDFITSVVGKSRVATIKSGKCMTCDVGLICRACNKPRGDVHPHTFIPFRDELSAREYMIGGMCQSCQDSVFGAENNFYEDDFL